MLFVIFVPKVPDAMVGPYFFLDTVLEVNLRRLYLYLKKFKLDFLNDLSRCW